MVDPGAFEWSDAGWPGASIRGQVIYEMHIGTFTGERSWAAAMRELPELARLGVTCLEIMPLGPTGLGGSPYSSPSAFAGNVNLVSPELLVSAGLLDRHDVDRPPGFGTSAGDDERAREYKRGILEKAFHHFKGRVQGDPELRRDYDEFLGQASSWIEDYAFFAALKDQHHGASWWTWAPAVARREPAALAQARDALGDVIEAHRFLQYVFVRQWLELRRHANEQGIRVIGDMPMRAHLATFQAYPPKRVMGLRAPAPGATPPPA